MRVYNAYAKHVTVITKVTNGAVPERIATRLSRQIAEIYEATEVQKAIIRNYLMGALDTEVLRSSLTPAEAHPVESLVEWFQLISGRHLSSYIIGSAINGITLVVLATNDYKGRLIRR